MQIDREATDRLSCLVRTPKVTDVRVGVLGQGDFPFRLVGYRFQDDSRVVRVDIQGNSEGAYRFDLYDGIRKGGLAFDISEEFGDVFFSGINFSEAFNEGYGSLMLPFFHAFLLGHGCAGNPIRVSFYQHKDGMDKDMVEASERMFRRQFNPVRVKSSDGYMKDCIGVV
tara:strand:+ start:100 stop:606 length:507 start_codon:yes stop_codon:yes gene_type:complete